MNKKRDSISDQELIEGLKKSEDWAYRILYKNYYKMCVSHVIKNSGTEDNALDLFQDAIIALIGNLVKPTFKLNEDTKLSSYFNSIFRNLWFTKLKQRKKMPTKNLDETFYNVAASDEGLTELIELEIKHDKIAKCFLKIGKDCKELLTNFYYKKIPLGEIGVQMGYTSSFVRVKKSRCMNSLRKCALENLNQ